MTRVTKIVLLVFAILAFSAGLQAGSGQSVSVIFTLRQKSHVGQGASLSPDATKMAYVGAPHGALHVVEIASRTDRIVANWGLSLINIFGNFPGWLEAVSTLGLLVFALWQMRFVRRSTTATENAANAAHENAVAAKQYSETAVLALQVNRPFVLIDKLRMDNFVPRTQLSGSHVNVTANCIVTNAGNGPAIITAITARMKVTARPFQRLNPPDFSDCQEIWVLWTKPMVLATNREANFVVRFDSVNLEDDLFYKIKRHEDSAFALYGTVTYEDVFENAYELTFGYLYSWGYDATGKGSWSFQVGPKEYNRHCQIKR